MVPVGPRDSTPCLTKRSQVGRILTSPERVTVTSRTLYRFVKQAGQDFLRWRAVAAETNAAVDAAAGLRSARGLRR